MPPQPIFDFSHFLKRVSHFFFFLALLGFELRASFLLGRHCITWVTPPALFWVGYFWDRVPWALCLSRLWSMIFSISASQVGGITGVNNQCLAGSHSFCTGLASDLDPPTYTSCIDGIIVMYHHTQIVCWDQSLANFLPCWPKTMIFLISAFWVAGIIDVSHCVWLNKHL
jgi:hypothetical protein